MRECERCGGDLGHPANGDWTCRNCHRGISGFAPGRINFFEGPPIERRAGGWFILDDENGWSGPWRSSDAAEAARRGDYAEAHRLQRSAP